LGRIPRIESTATTSMAIAIAMLVVAVLSILGILPNAGYL
jgi:hypothetical protein